jgi:hypothetical protein
MSSIFLKRLDSDGLGSHLTRWCRRADSTCFFYRPRRFFVHAASRSEKGRLTMSEEDKVLEVLILVSATRLKESATGGLK